MKLLATLARGGDKNLFRNNEVHGDVCPSSEPLCARCSLLKQQKRAGAHANTQTQAPIALKQDCAGKAGAVVSSFASKHTESRAIAGL